MSSENAEAGRADRTAASAATLVAAVIRSKKTAGCGIQTSQKVGNEVVFNLQGQRMEYSGSGRKEQTRGPVFRANSNRSTKAPEKTGIRTEGYSTPGFRHVIRIRR